MTLNGGEELSQIQGMQTLNIHDVSLESINFSHSQPVHSKLSRFNDRIEMRIKTDRLINWPIYGKAFRRTHD